MKILILGSGPVAVMLAASLRPEHRVALATRTPRAQHLDVRAVPLPKRRFRRARDRVVPLMALDAVAGEWDLVVSTAPPTAPGVAQILAGRTAASVMAVTQVPSEVHALERFAGDRYWGLIVPGFLAWGTDPVRWWQLNSRFTPTGTAAELVKDAFVSRTPVSSTPQALMEAATMMPVIAGLHELDFDVSAAAGEATRLARAANEARAAIAAAHALPAPRRIRPLAVSAALRLLPRVAPMDFNRYLRTHFGKHAAQTTALLSDWITAAQQHGLEPVTLEGLFHALSQDLEWSPPR